MAKPLFLTLCLAILFDSCSLKKDWSDDKLSLFEAWQVPIEIRLSRAAFIREPLVREIRLEGLSGEWLSAQVAIRSSRDIKELSGSFTDLAGPEGSIIPADSGLVRFGGFIPVDSFVNVAYIAFAQGLQQFKASVKQFALVFVASHVLSRRHRVVYRIR